MQIRNKDVQLQAKETALNARLGGTQGDIDPIGGIAWGLCFAEYQRRTKQFDMVAPHALRSKTDQHGNKWSIQTFPIIPPEERNEAAEALALALGYDPFDPPTDTAWLLHCQPDKGSYDIAIGELEKSQNLHLKAQRKLMQAQTAMQEAMAKNRQDAALKASQEVDEAQAEVQSAIRKFQECKAVIENAIQRYYLITLEAFERFDEYQMPLKCHKADVIPQKRHQNLPDYTPQLEEYIPPADGVPR